jgi:hypothetical protein
MRPWRPDVQPMHRDHAMNGPVSGATHDRQSTRSSKGRCPTNQALARRNRLKVGVRAKKRHRWRSVIPDRRTMSMNRQDVRRRRRGDSVMSSPGDATPGFLAEFDRGDGVVHTVGVSPSEKWNGLCTRFVRRRRARPGGGPDRSNPSGIRQGPWLKQAGGIGSLARCVGMPSHAPRRIPGQLEQIPLGAVSACA